MMSKGQDVEGRVRTRRVGIAKVRERKRKMKHEIKASPLL
jgi:hypothetical protein